MISVIYSTRKKDESFIDSIKKSIGIKDVEILCYENNNQYSLTEIYNKGLKESKNNIVVLLHDDILFKTPNWGKTLLNHYNTTDYGILGVAGSRYIAENGVWWSRKEAMYGNLNHTDGEKEWENNYSKNLGHKIAEVCVLDGVFMSCDKNRIKSNFDENYKGFHYYDIPFCLSNFDEGVKIGVHFDIKITHKSIGVTNDEWEKNRQQFINDEKYTLPAHSDLGFPYKNTIKTIKNEPKLAIIIPTKNKVDELLLPCLESILETNYHNYKIYVADTGSDNNELKLINNFIKGKEDKIKLIKYDYYNFSKINNDVVRNHIEEDTELLLFSNNDIEMINDAISIMVDTYINTPKCGTVGARLHYEDGSLQHMGMLIRPNNKLYVITHNYLNYDFNNLTLYQTKVPVIGNTAAFMLIQKKLFEEINMFNEEYVKCFEDVELNLQCILNNKTNMLATNAVLYHLESQTRENSVDKNDVVKINTFITQNKDKLNIK